MCAKYFIVLMLLLPFYCSCIIVDCKYDDQKCLTGLAQQEYIDFIDGKPGKVDASDPMEIDEIAGNLPEVKYTFRTFKLTGLRDCIPVLVHFTKGGAADYHLSCPRLRIQAKYEIIGNMLDLKIDDKGDVDIQLSDYKIMLHGAISVTHVESGNVIQVTSFHSVVDIKGDVQFDMKSELEDKKEERETISKIFRENGKEVTVTFGGPIVEAFMKKLMRNLNHFLKLIPDEIKE